MKADIDGIWVVSKRDGSDVELTHFYRLIYKDKDVGILGIKSPIPVGDFLSAKDQFRTLIMDVMKGKEILH